MSNIAARMIWMLRGEYALCIYHDVLVKGIDITNHYTQTRTSDMPEYKERTWEQYIRWQNDVE